MRSGSMEPPSGRRGQNDTMPKQQMARPTTRPLAPGTTALAMDDDVVAYSQRGKGKPGHRCRTLDLGQEWNPNVSHVLYRRASSAVHLRIRSPGYKKRRHPIIFNFATAYAAIVSVWAPARSDLSCFRNFWRPFQLNIDRGHAHSDATLPAPPPPRVHAAPAPAPLRARSALPDGM
ncbi:hypothetical protein EVAR_84983_1 [Eumeta japonica]|uniref:Uncharacterized protein n=1 Tax=Eumeta variegata TaxID=151549 RepID=A0A4C1W8J6_EUMVA|nr:hypothetical protein EVAR_84983_1 [Eumeta japonica]